MTGERVTGERRIKRTARRGGVSLLAVTVALLLPSAGFALAGLGQEQAGEQPGLARKSDPAAFTPASVDPKVARFVAERTSGKTRMMRFTPTGMGDRLDRSVTVAIRIDDKAAQAISVRSAIAAAKEQVADNPAVQISPMRYNLGLSRNYRSFAQAPQLSESLSQANVPDLSAFEPATAEEKPSRFAAHITVEEDQTAVRGAAPGSGRQSLDVAGSYRLTHNLNVTAGVRYSQDRDRLAPLVTTELPDAQAVYIGTKFRF